MKIEKKEKKVSSGCKSFSDLHWNVDCGGDCVSAACKSRGGLLYGGDCGGDC